ncbi:unnamed protein product [Danaus chrysippus]|uniref:(African queen) hypothetical protein n=1 Tax=Danaus chrysippus TaxID=151541 RepID=A0A8J2R1M4_9NEOP|nr:unnamed protein product [Danaus chrysippus]
MNGCCITAQEHMAWLGLVTSLCLAVLVVTSITCEPPVNSYLPPGGSSGSSGRPSSQYGPPGSNQGRFGGVGSGRGRPGENYDQSGRSLGSPSSEYGAPGAQGFQDGSQDQQGPNSQYRTPNQGGSGNLRGPASGRGTPQRPDSSYGTPLQGFQSGDQNNFPGQGGFSGQGSSRPGVSPSSSYGTPDFGNGRNIENESYRSSGVDESNGPAKYEFSYEVDDAETGTMFGHSEQRNGDLTTGQYNVVLPDGRKQVVEYEADQDGYKPQIRYEGAGRGVGGSGFGQGGRNGGQGYPGVGANADAFANAQSGAQQGGNYQSGFGDGSGGGYPSGRPGSSGEDFLGNQGFPGSGSGSEYPRGSGGSSFPGRSQSNFPGQQGNQGYSTGPQGAGGAPRGSGRGPNAGGGGSGEGYPSGGPNGQRGSGY